MNSDSYLEKNISQNPAVELFQALGYTYISPEDCGLQRGSRYHVLLKDILREQLRRMNRFSYAGTEKEFSAASIQQAINDLEIPLTDGLVRTSEKIYDALLLGKSYPELVGAGEPRSFNLKYIDWEHPENNVKCISDSTLRFCTADGVTVSPLYDVHRQRYVVYWNVELKTYSNEK